MKNRRLIVSRLAKLNPSRIILFGSHARGDSDRFSDIDIIIIKETNKRFLDRLTEVAHALSGIPDKIDAFVYTPREFAEMKKNGNPFILKAIKEGKVIYEASKVKRKAMV